MFFSWPLRVDQSDHCQLSTVVPKEDIINGHFNDMAEPEARQGWKKTTVEDPVIAMG